MKTPKIKLKTLNKVMKVFGCQFVVLYDPSQRKETKMFLEFIGWG